MGTWRIVYWFIILKKWNERIKVNKIFKSVFFIASEIVLNQICSVWNWLITDSCNINNIIAPRRHCMATPLFRIQVRLVLNAKIDIVNACTIR